MYESAHNYFKSALQYIQKKFPFDDEVINNAVWIDVENRGKATWVQTQFFLGKYGDVESIQSINANELYDEFCSYQLLCLDDIPEETWDEAKVSDGKDSDENKIFHYGVNLPWWDLSNLLVTGTNMKRFKHLIKADEID